MQVAVTGQGCADEGLCYPPMTQTFVLQAAGDGYRAVGEQVRDRVPPPRDETPAAAAPAGRPGRPPACRRPCAAAPGTGRRAGPRRRPRLRPWHRLRLRSRRRLRRARPRFHPRRGFRLQPPPRPPDRTANPG
ncbi:protein-disulfide reductase DsbD domain-containing protein [Castellaniella defragrans]|uniref:protein-disulfide reductase DsbD domain-containing protein n=1 Tax=Castellaniella defragrans TaxID=75697 RepID=UPI00396A2AEF